MDKYILNVLVAMNNNLLSIAKSLKAIEEKIEEKEVEDDAVDNLCD